MAASLAAGIGSTEGEVLARVASYLTLEPLSRAVCCCHSFHSTLFHDCVALATRGACLELGLTAGLTLSIPHLIAVRGWLPSPPAYREPPMVLAQTDAESETRFMSRTLDGAVAAAVARQNVLGHKFELATKRSADEVRELATKALALIHWAPCRHTRKLCEHGMDRVGDMTGAIMSDSFFMHVRDRYESTMHIWQAPGGARKTLRLIVDQEEEGCSDYIQSTLAVRCTMDDDLGYEGTSSLLDFEWTRGDTFALRMDTDNKRAWAEIAKSVFESEREIAAVGEFLCRCLCAPMVDWRADGGVRRGVSYGSPWFKPAGAEESEQTAAEAQSIFFEVEQVFRKAAREVLPIVTQMLAREAGEWEADAPEAGGAGEEDEVN